MFAIALTFSVVGLLVGPTLFAWARGRSVAVAALDGATLGVVPALLLVRILPHLVEEVGAAALVALMAGYVGFLLVESRGHDWAARVGLALVLPTLALHSFLDGAALAVAFSKSTAAVGSAALGLALVIHKVPEGLFLASSFGPSVGTRGAFARIRALGATTVLGALSGRELLAHTPDYALHVVIAAGLGIMLRMVIHRHDEAETGPRERVASGCAFVLCLIPVAALPSPLHVLDWSQPHELSAARALVPLFVESAPWLLVVLVLSEIHGFSVPAQRRDTGGAPSAWAATTALTVVLLGPIFALVRAVLEPVLRGVATHRPHRRPFFSAFADIAPRAALVLPSYAAGVVLSVVAEAALPGGALGGVPGMVALPAAMLGARVLSVGPAGASVIAAVLVHKGLPPSAGLAFMLTGAAATSRSSWKWRAVALALVAGSSALVGWILPALVSPPLHDLGAHQHPVYEWLAAAILVAWTMLELVRQGPREWVRAAFSRTVASPPHPPIRAT